MIEFCLECLQQKSIFIFFPQSISWPLLAVTPVLMALAGGKVDRKLLKVPSFCSHVLAILNLLLL